MRPSKIELLFLLALGEAVVIIVLGLALIQASQPVSAPVIVQLAATPASLVQPRASGASFPTLAATAPPTALPIIESTPLLPTATPTFVSPPTALPIPAVPVQPALPNDQPAIPVQPGMPPPTVTSVYAPPPTSVPVQACDPSYPDFCIPPLPAHLTCQDISAHNFTALQPDPHGFDRDHDGIGCEQ